MHEFVPGIDSADVERSTPRSATRVVPAVQVAARGTDAISDQPPLFTVAMRREELVAAYPELAPVCDDLGFGPGVSLAAWSVAPGWALLALARTAAPPHPVSARDWSFAEISELVDDLLVHHHRPLRNELQRLRVLVHEFEQRHGMVVSQCLKAVFDWTSDSILTHLAFEEDIVFPQCRMAEAISRGWHVPSAWELPVTRGLRTMVNGHEEHSGDLAQLLGHVERIMDQCCDPDLGAIRAALGAISTDFVTHSHLEGNILMPAAIFSEELIRAHAPGGV